MLPYCLCIFKIQSLGKRTDVSNRQIQKLFLQRLNKEIRRRSSVVGIFPSTDSYIRLITSYLLEYTEDWQTEKAYMNAGSIQSQKEILFNAA